MDKIDLIRFQDFININLKNAHLWNFDVLVQDLKQAIIAKLANFELTACETNSGKVEYYII